jgi:acylphosphatase
MIAKKVIFSGHVQGVAFRRQAKDAADKAGITGWIRNLVDGTVEALFCGEESSVYKIINFCAHDLRRADVSTYIVKDADCPDEKEFTIL